MFLCASAIGVVAAEMTAVPRPVHPDGWSWDELARLAGARADKAKVELLKAVAKRQSVEDGLAWKDPQLRLGHTWTDSHNHSWDGNMDLPLPSRPENGDGETWTAGVRFYISNPFVNRQLRRQGDAQVEAREARAQAEAYAVYCEVKSLCLDEEFARREEQFRRDELALVQTIRDVNASRLEQGVSRSPVDALKAEIARERTSLQIEDALLARARTRSQIAFLTGIPVQELKIRYTPPEPPATNAAYGAVLVETAFARRPDLARAMAEYEAAQAGVGAAQAANIPWFDFVEGSYAHQSADEVNWGTEKFNGMRYARRGRKSSHDDDWQLRLAMTVPIFTWFGNSVKRSKLVAEAADVRVQALRAAIENEVGTALAAFRVADARFVHLSDDGAAFLAKMERRLEDCAAESAIPPEDVAKARLELLGYRRMRARSEFEWIRGILLLESVSGGALPHLPPVSSTQPHALTEISAPVPQVRSVPAEAPVSLLEELLPKADE